MKNVTIALDETTLRDARRIAAERSTSLNALIRDFLERLTLRESSARKARRRIAELCRDSKAEVGARRWTRDELHER
jgi:hypothetical protein